MDCHKTITRESYRIKNEHGNMRVVFLANVYILYVIQYLITVTAFASIIWNKCGTKLFLEINKYVSYRPISVSQWKLCEIDYLTQGFWSPIAARLSLRSLHFYRFPILKKTILQLFIQKWRMTMSSKVEKST